MVALEPLLQELREKGMPLSQLVAQSIQEAVGDDMTDSVGELLSELSSGKLLPVNVEPILPRNQLDARVRNYDPSQARYDIRQLQFIDLARERKLNEVLALKLVTSHLKKACAVNNFFSCPFSKDLEAANVPFTDSMNVMLMELYSHYNRLEDALAVHDKLITDKPDVIIHPNKLANLCISLLQADRNDDALRVVNSFRKGSEIEDASRYEFPIRRMLNVAAEKGDIALTQKLFDRIEETGVIKMRNVTGSLVKVHLVK